MHFMVNEINCPLPFRLNFVSICTEGDDLKSENPSKAIENFEKVVVMETARGDQVKWYIEMHVLHCSMFRFDLLLNWSGDSKLCKIWW